MEATEVATIVDELRTAFETRVTRPIAWREQQLRALFALHEENEQSIMNALEADLRKPALEAYATELGFVKGEIAHTLAHLPKWMRPEKVRTPIKAQLLNFRAKSRIHREPVGVVLIIGPWNYPFQLLLAPLIGALAAGNCAILKPSEITPRCSAVVAELIPRYLDPDGVRVIEGGVAETTALLEQKFDHIFFTGSTTVGRVVAQAAAQHLTPVTLELGGKSPCIVDREVDLEVAARRIVWGKFFNAGQTCVSPDYVLVDKQLESTLLEALTRTIHEFYGDDPQNSPDLARIVSVRHQERLIEFFKDGDVVVGGTADGADRYVAPTVLKNVSLDAPVMSDEIFGPILPVIPVDDMDEAIRFVNARPKPLALYVFSRDSFAARKVLDNTSSGGACVNDTISHLMDPNLPFGGVGDSGMGAYHGRYSFEVFSHRKSVLDRATWIDLKLRYPPFGGSALGLIRRLLG